MFHMLSCSLTWNGRQLKIPLGKKTFLEDCYLDFARTQGKYGVRYQLHIHPKENLRMEEIKIVFQAEYQPDTKVMCNGYQSWSTSREMGINEKIRPLRTIARPYFKYSGDQHLEILKEESPDLYSWTFGYLRNNDEIQFLGSINESSGFTLINYEPIKRTITALVDCKGMEIQHSFPAIDLWVAEGRDIPVIEEYFSLFGPLTKPPKVTGWTSWYQHYTNINEKVINENLKGFKKAKVDIDFFQIDDGYQKNVGDWLEVDQEKFPNGMRNIADKIRKAGYQPGIWIAPFVCGKDSTIFKNHKNWLLKDKNGRPIKAGYIPLWGGWYYALNFYNVKFQEYLIGVFHTMMELWNFDLVKIDFLFAASIAPPGNKTPGQVMNEAMTFIRRQVGAKKIIGCGVPLGAAIGKVDYCRIGTDIHLSWENRLLNFLRFKERVSCHSAMQSVFSRWFMDSRAFGNDPDVVLLREEGNKLTAHQKKSILIANALLGSLVFTSDNPDQWNKEQKEDFKLIKSLQAANIIIVRQFNTDQYEIQYTLEGKQHSALFNLSKKKTTLNLEEESISLAPYEVKLI